MKPVLFVLYLLYSTHIFAKSSEKRLHDIPGKRSITYYDQSMERRFPKLNFYDEVSLYYPVITGQIDSLVRNKINKRLYELSTSIIDSNSLWKVISLHHDKTLLSYTRNNPNFRDDRGYYSDNELKYEPVIDQVKLSLTTYYNHILAVELVYEYHSQFESHKIDNDFTYRTMYYFDTRNGREYKSGEIFNPSSLPALNKLIESKIIAYFEKYPAKMPEDYDEEDEEKAFYRNLKPNNDQKEKKLTGFSADKNGFWSTLAFSMVLRLDEWDPVMDNFYGYPITLRISFNDIKAFINPKGPYASLLQFQSGSNTVLKEQNNYKRVTTGFDVSTYTSTSEVNGYDYYSLQTQKAIKRIELYKLNDDPRDTVREFKQRALLYAENGNLRECRYFDNNRYQSHAVFGFDTARNLTKIALLNGAQITESQDLHYDQNKNLLRLDQFERYRGYSEVYYWYLDSIVLSEEINSQNTTARITCQRYQNGMPTELLVAGSSEYTRITRYGKQGNILYKNAYESAAGRGEFYTYDEKGRLICRENDGNNTRSVYSYDSLGRISEERVYSQTELNFSKKLWYNAEGLPAQIEIVHGINGKPNTLYFRYSYY